MAIKDQERQLIEKVTKGDVSSFSYFVETYQNMAYTIAFRICKNKQDAEDYVQESFVSAFKNIHTFQFNSKFSTWFYRIVYNAAIGGAKKNVHELELSHQHESLSCDGSSNGVSMEERERIKIVNQIIDRLPVEESIILTLFYMEEHSVKDVAQMIGISESNVKVRLHRARKSFGETMRSLNLEEVLKYSSDGR